jgi:hypothetical protein
MNDAFKNFLKSVLPGFILTPIYWIRSHSLVRGRLTYRQDGLFATCNIDFLQEPKFVEAYRLGREAGIFNDMPIHYRAYLACWAALKGRELEGDFVECGVYRGAMTRMILHYIDFQLLPQKRFYLLDTFNGVPLESLTEEEISLRRPAKFEESYERVKKTFSAFENVTVVRGAIPGTLTEVKSDRVAYLSLDMNAAAPEIAAAEYFWPKLVSGAVVLLDDYGWPYHDVQRREFDRFAARHGVKVLPAPTGQGLIFKP